MAGSRLLQRDVGIGRFNNLEGKWGGRIRAGGRPALRQPEGEGEGSGKGSKPDGAIAHAEGGALPPHLLSPIGHFSSRRV